MFLEKKVLPLRSVKSDIFFRRVTSAEKLLFYVIQWHFWHSKPISVFPRKVFGERLTRRGQWLSTNSFKPAIFFCVDTEKYSLCEQFALFLRNKKKY
jgi:hypothetical protein